MYRSDSDTERGKTGPARAIQLIWECMSASCSHISVTTQASTQEPHRHHSHDPNLILDQGSFINIPGIWTRGRLSESVAWIRDGTQEDEYTSDHTVVGQSVFPYKVITKVSMVCDVYLPPVHYTF